MLKFELTEKMVEIIGNALGVQPYNVVAPVIVEMQKQVNEQQKPTDKPSSSENT